MKTVFHFVAVQISLLILVGSASASDSNTQHPFGAHAFSYKVSHLRPSSMTKAQIDQATTTFYDEWKRLYLKPGCTPDRYYIESKNSEEGGANADTISVSEGQGYGMIIEALMAGYDPQAKMYFDGLFRFFKDHPSSSSPFLMAWNQIQGCANAPDGGSYSASDGDLDIAYALILADRQWGSRGEIDYLKEAKSVLQAILDHDVNASTQTMSLGSFVDLNEPAFFWSTRPSDFMPDHFRIFKQVSDGSAWSSVLDNSYQLLQHVQFSSSPAAGLLPDFIVDLNSAPKPASPNFLETRYDGEFSYNACRVPWRLATDFLTSADPRALSLIEKMNDFARNSTGADASRLVDGYTLAGSRSRGADGSSMAFTAPLAVGAMTDTNHQAWLDSLWTQVIRSPASSEKYYGNTIKLLSMIVISENWWTP